MTKQLRLFRDEIAPSIQLSDQKLPNKREGAAARAFARKLSPRVRLTEEPVIVGMLGLTGSGKSAVAREFAEHIGGTVLAHDEICLELRRRHASYEGGNDILRIVALGIIHLGGNAVIDSDLIEAHDRRALRTMCRRLGIRLVFVRTHADLDTILKRALPTDYLSGEYQNVVPLRKQADVGHEDAFIKLNKMMVHLPKHYRIDCNRRHRRLIIKAPPRNLLADIDTTKFNEWRMEVAKCVRRHLK